jgi:hypothetical protein
MIFKRSSRQLIVLDSCKYNKYCRFSICILRTTSLHIIRCKQYMIYRRYFQPPSFPTPVFKYTQTLLFSLRFSQRGKPPQSNNNHHPSFHPHDSGGAKYESHYFTFFRFHGGRGYTVTISISKTRLTLPSFKA